VNVRLGATSDGAIQKKRFGRCGKKEIRRDCRELPAGKGKRFVKTGSTAAKKIAEREGKVGRHKRSRNSSMEIKSFCLSGRRRESGRAFESNGSNSSEQHKKNRFEDSAKRGSL